MVLVDISVVVSRTVVWVVACAVTVCVLISSVVVVTVRVTVCRGADEQTEAAPRKLVKQDREA